MPAKLLNVVKAVILLLPSILMGGCMNDVGNTIQSTPTGVSPLPLAAHAEVRLSRPGEQSFYYADGARTLTFP
jgi:hypothetical protein